MSTHNSSEERTFQVSPAVQHAFALYQQRMKLLYQEFLAEAESSGMNCPEQQLQRFGPRLELAFLYFQNQLKGIFHWLFRSKEESNFTYDITDRNKMYLASAVALISGSDPVTVQGYIDELNGDQALRNHVRAKTLSSSEMSTADPEARYGRRLGWYAMARALKPKILIETGIDKGLGSCVLCAALKRNAEEGNPGHYFGTDINPDAGFLFTEPYSQHGEILYGDSIESLRQLNVSIDMFINDSDHSAEYEAREYDLIESKLSPAAIVLGDNAHSTSKLCEFAQRTGREFIFVPEWPEQHWYPGAGIGFAFKRERPRVEHVQEPKVDWETPVSPTQIATSKKKRPRCVFINTFYDSFLRWVFQVNPNLAGCPYAEQKRVLIDTFFGDSDFYSRNLAEAGWDTHDLIVNSPETQRQWCLEHKIQATGYDLVFQQIEHLGADVVYIQDLNDTPAELLKRLKSSGKLVAGQIASPVDSGTPIELYDLIFTSFPHFVKNFRAKGITAYYQPLAFDRRVLETLGNKSFSERQIGCSFVGGFSRSHLESRKLFEEVAQNTSIEFWGYGAELLPVDSAIRGKHHGEVWGRQMFGTLLNSRITVNRHANFAENFANNMRLFEATGCGAMLITDYKDNLNDLFEIGKELVAYRTMDELVELIRYYENHPGQAAAIANAGRERTLRDHSYRIRQEHTAEVLERHLRYKTEQHQAPDYSTISAGHIAISDSQATSTLDEGWKDSSIPGSQRALVQKELTQMYEGLPIKPFEVLRELLHPIVSAQGVLLEIGCSSGYYYEVLEYLLNRRIRYTGVDYSNAMIEMARSYYPKADFLVADGAALPFEDRQFHVVLSGCVLIHCKNYVEHIRETARVAGEYIVAHRTPICKGSATRMFRKKAYNVDTVELWFNEEEFISEFAKSAFVLDHTVEYHSNPAEDFYETSFRFKRV